MKTQLVMDFFKILVSDSLNVLFCYCIILYYTIQASAAYVKFVIKYPSIYLSNVVQLLERVESRPGLDYISLNANEAISISKNKNRLDTCEN